MNTKLQNYAINRIHEIRIFYTNKENFPFDELLTTNFIFLLIICT